MARSKPSADEGSSSISVEYLQLEASTFQPPPRLHTILDIWRKVLEVIPELHDPLWRRLLIAGGRDQGILAPLHQPADEIRAIALQRGEGINATRHRYRATIHFEMSPLIGLALASSLGKLSGCGHIWIRRENVSPPARDRATAASARRYRLPKTLRANLKALVRIR
jgi:hypothetical protein